MKAGLHFFGTVSALLFSVTVLAGCYTELGTVRSEEEPQEEPLAYEDTADGEYEEYYGDYYPSPNYYATFSYYYPGVQAGFGYGYWDPWYWGSYPYYPGSWYCYYPSPYVYWPPVYACWPVSYYGYYTPYHGGYYGHYGSGYYPVSPPRDVTTRDFGNTRGITGRTVGGTRGTGRSGGLRSGEPGADQMPVATVSDRTPTQRSPATVNSGRPRSKEKAARTRTSRRYAVPGTRFQNPPKSADSRTRETSVRSRTPQGPAPGTSMKPQSAPTRSGSSVQPGRSSTRSSSPPARSTPGSSSRSSGSRGRPR